MQDLCNALEEALRYRVQQGQISGLSIYTGQGDYEKEPISLVVSASGGNEFPLASGNFTITVDCELRYPADSEDLPAHRQAERDAFAILMSDDLASKLSEEAENFHCFGISGRQIRSGVDDNQWMGVLSMEVYCCLTDLT